jgi:hypothetical protein
MQLHQPGWRSRLGFKLDGERWKRFRQWQFGHTEHHWRISGYDQRGRYLHRLARFDRPSQNASDGGESAATAAERGQTQPV